MSSVVRSLICRFIAGPPHQARDYSNGGKVYNETVKLTTQYDQGLVDNNEAQEEIQTFQAATPWGEISFQIDNPAAIGYVKDGLEYYVKVEMVPLDEQSNQKAVEVHFPDYGK